MTYKYIEVIIPIDINKTFIYKVKFNLKIGSRVLVPFANKGNYTGLVYNINVKKPNYEVRDIIYVIDHESIINETHIKCWDWLAKYYVTNLGVLVKLILPSFFIINSKTFISLINYDINIRDIKNISDDEILLINTLKLKYILSLDEIKNIFNKKNIHKILKKLFDNNIIIFSEQAYDKYKPIYKKYIKLNKIDFDNINCTNITYKQKDLLLKIISLFKGDFDAKIMVDDLLNNINCSKYILNSLFKKGLIHIYKKDINRLDIDFNNYTENINFNINKIQYEYIKKIYKKLTNKPLLIQGLNFNDKQNIYIKLIYDFFKRKRKILYVVPDINLIFNVVKILKNLGIRVFVYYSNINENEKIDIWSKVYLSDYNVIIGTGISLFLPFISLDLILIDNENDICYKQNIKPYINYRDYSIYLSSIYKCRIILFSNSPSIESYNNVILQKYLYINFFNKQTIHSDIKIIDLKKDKSFNNEIKISKYILKEISIQLLKKNKILIIYNRRGYFNYFQCNNCGHISECKNCDVNLVYHNDKDILKCHYCGFYVKNINICPVCKSNDIVSNGIGIQRIEDFFKKKFLNSSICRIDSDSIKSKRLHNVLQSKIDSNEIDIIIATNIIIKGFDFKNISLISILNIDSLFKYPDFRSEERAFHILSNFHTIQNNININTKFIFQTYYIDHYIFKSLLQNDYTVFFKHTINNRKKYYYPPYYRLIKISLKHKKKDTLDNISYYFFNYLNSPQKDYIILGPDYPYISKIKEFYIKDMYLKIPKNYNLINRVKYLILLCINNIKNTFRTKIDIIINVDP